MENDSKGEMIVTITMTKIVLSQLIDYIADQPADGLIPVADLRELFSRLTQNFAMTYEGMSLDLDGMNRWININ